MFSTDATVVDLTARLCQQQRNSFSLNTFDPWLVEATMWSLWMLGGADYIVNLYFQMCCIFSFQMNDSMTCSEFWHFGAKKLTAQLPHKLSPGPGGYIIVVTGGRVAWYRLKRKEQCVKTGRHLPTLYHHVAQFQRVPFMLCCEWCSRSPTISDHIFTPIPRTLAQGNVIQRCFLIFHYTCDGGLWTATSLLIKETV